MTGHSRAGRAFGLLMALGGATAALLAALLWWQAPHLAEGVWLACQSAAQALEGLLPMTGLLLPLALLFIGGLRGFGMAGWQLWCTARMLRDLKRRQQPLPADLARLSAELQLHGRVTLVEDTDAYAFAAGLARPGIWLSTGLLALLDERELAAVLRHEQHHLRRRDPLRVLAARSLAHALFFLPLASALRNLYLEAKEVEADAASGAGHELASALLKLVRAGQGSSGVLPLAAAGAIQPSTAQRVRYLLAEDRTSRGLGWSGAVRLVVSLVLVGALVAVTTLATVRAAGPFEGGECGYSTRPATEAPSSTPATFTPANAVIER